MKIIVAGNLPERFITSLKSLGFEPLLTCRNANLLPGLMYHPDMQIAKVNGVYICDRSLYDYYLELMSSGDGKLICGDTACSCNYPEDVAYNIKVINNTVFHNFKYTDPCLSSHMEGKTRAQVPQGYSGCSICALGHKAIVTADVPIAKEALALGIDALLISPGNIALEGFSEGFIGGAGFYFDNTVYFFGDIATHPDGHNIYDFCQKHGVSIHCLCPGPLMDFGSAITLD